jgi:hypothetical protein
MTDDTKDAPFCLQSQAMFMYAKGLFKYRFPETDNWESIEL